MSSGSPFATVNDRSISCKGDKIACKHNCVIVEGSETETFFGVPMALHGSRTSNGCICISGNNNYHGDGKNVEQIAAVPVAADAGMAYMPEIAQLLNEDHWVEFRLVDGKSDPIPNQPFELTDPAGKMMPGTLDANGYARVEPVKAGACTVHFPQLGCTMTVGA